METITHISKVIGVVTAIGGCLYFILRLTLINYYTREQADNKFMQSNMCDRLHLEIKDVLHEIKEEIRYLRDKR